MVQLSVEEAMAEIDRIGREFERGDCSDVLGGEVKEIVLHSFADNFANSQTPEGIHWPPRKPRPDDDGHPLLILSGSLLRATVEEEAGSITRVGHRELNLGVDKDVIPYAGVHNFGYPERNIPQREYLGASEEALDDCGEVIGDFVQKKIG